MVELTGNISGRVQGVGFRWSIKREATSLSLVGYVRNEPDGSVTFLAQGPKGKLEKLLSFLKKGPVFARINHVDYCFNEDYDKIYDIFMIQR